MFSKLSSGVKNANYYNQAARNVACIAEVLRRGNKKPDELLFICGRMLFQVFSAKI